MIESQGYSTYSIKENRYKVKNWKKLLGEQQTPFMSDIRVYPALKDTFIMLHETYPGQQITHFDKNGTMLHEYYYSTGCRLYLNLLQQKFIVMLVIDEGKWDIRITCINLETGEQQHNQLEINAGIQCKEQVSFFAFRQSQLICVCQNIFRTNQNIYTTGFIITYYKLDKNLLYLKRLFTQQISLPSTRIDYRNKAVKLNDISMIGFLPQENIFEQRMMVPFFIYDIETDPKKI